LHYVIIGRLAVKLTWKPGDTITCREDTGDGGYRALQFPPDYAYSNIQDCMEIVAKHFEDLEEISTADCEGAVHTIIVTGIYDEPVTYVVRCYLERRYRVKVEGCSAIIE
jgi:hypothetical protein